MNKAQLELIADVLQRSKEFTKREALLRSALNESPEKVKYLKFYLIPKIDEAYKIIEEIYQLEKEQHDKLQNE